MRLADFIDGNLPLIIERWEAYARSLPPGAAMDTLALRDHAEQILHAVAEDLRAPQTALEQDAKARGLAVRSPGAPNTAAETHAVLRATAGFSVQQLVGEYRALRASVLRLWSDDRQPLDEQAMDDIGRFNEAIDQALAESVDFFSKEVERWRHVFLGVLGHDLRGPLNAVLLTSQLISQMSAGTPLTDQSERLMRSGKRMKELLDDLLDFSRTSLGLGIPVARAPCDLTAVCEDEVDLQATVWPHASIRFESDGPTPGRWDASRMKQVIGNLISNAVRYGSSPGPVWVRLRHDDAEVVLSVTNAGEPIAAETLTSLFEPLRRGATTVDGASDRSSLGLGLFIVREVVRAHGGTVAVASGDGETVFTLHLPRAPV